MLLFFLLFFQQCWGQISYYSCWDFSAVQFLLTTQTTLVGGCVGRDVTLCTGSWALYFSTLWSWLARSLQVWPFPGVIVTSACFILYIKSQNTTFSVWYYGYCVQNQFFLIYICLPECPLLKSGENQCCSFLYCTFILYILLQVPN